MDIHAAMCVSGRAVVSTRLGGFIRVRVRPAKPRLTGAREPGPGPEGARAPNRGQRVPEPGKRPEGAAPGGAGSGSAGRRLAIEVLLGGSHNLSPAIFLPRAGAAGCRLATELSCGPQPPALWPASTHAGAAIGLGGAFIGPRSLLGLLPPALSLMGSGSRQRSGCWLPLAISRNRALHTHGALSGSGAARPSARPSGVLGRLSRSDPG